ncbi:MAG: DUF3592 domain-containing protein, partial [Pseudomonadota bacterium]
MITDPRHGRTRPRRWLSLFVALAFWRLVPLGGLSFLAFVGLSLDMAQTKRFAEEGVQVTAVVVQKQSDRQRRVLLRFDADGKELNVWQKLPRKHFYWTAVGSRHTIRYLPDDPQSVEVFPGANSWFYGLFWSFLILLIQSRSGAG